MANAKVGSLNQIGDLLYIFIYIILHKHQTLKCVKHFSNKHKLANF